MVKIKESKYKIIDKKNEENIDGVIYKVKQIKRIKKPNYILNKFKVNKTIKTENKTLIIWKPNMLKQPNLKGKFLLLESDFNDIFTDFNNIKILKEVKNKELLKILN